jgi:hypothetical protein
MAKGTSKSTGGCWDARSALVNTDEPETGLYWAEQRVLGIQVKLREWACGDPHRRLDDLFNLVTDPAFLLQATLPRPNPTLVPVQRCRAGGGARL